MCVKNKTIIYVVRASNSKRDCDACSLLLLAAIVRSFAHMPLGISGRFAQLNEIDKCRCLEKQEFQAGEQVSPGNNISVNLSHSNVNPTTPQRGNLGHVTRTV